MVAVQAAARLRALGRLLVAALRLISCRIVHLRRVSFQRDLERPIDRQSAIAPPRGKFPPDQAVETGRALAIAETTSRTVVTTYPTVKITVAIHERIVVTTVSTTAWIAASDFPTTALAGLITGKSGATIASRGATTCTII